MFWALGQGQGPDAAVAAASTEAGGAAWPAGAATMGNGSAGSRLDELERQGSGAHWSPRAALAAAAAAKHGLDWMQASISLHSTLVFAACYAGLYCTHMLCQSVRPL